MLRRRRPAFSARAVVKPTHASHALGRHCTSGARLELDPHPLRMRGSTGDADGATNTLHWHAGSAARRGAARRSAVQACPRKHRRGRQPGVFAQLKLRSWQGASEHRWHAAQCCRRERTCPNWASRDHSTSPSRMPTVATLVSPPTAAPAPAPATRCAALWAFPLPLPLPLPLPRPRPRSPATRLIFLAPPTAASRSLPVSSAVSSAAPWASLRLPPRPPGAPPWAGPWAWSRERKRAVMFFGWVFSLILLGGQAPHVRPIGVRRACGEPRRNRIDRHGGGIERLGTRTWAWAASGVNVRGTSILHMRAITSSVSSTVLGSWLSLAR